MTTAIAVIAFFVVLFAVGYGLDWVLGRQRRIRYERYERAMRERTEIGNGVREKAGVRPNMYMSPNYRQQSETAQRPPVDNRRSTDDGPDCTSPAMLQFYTHSNAAASSRRPDADIDTETPRHTPHHSPSEDHTPHRDSHSSYDAPSSHDGGSFDSGSSSSDSGSSSSSD